jgi:hypothetical protein
MPALPVMVLGADSRAAGDYPGEHVRVIPEPFLSEKMLSLAGQMLAENELKTA